MKILKLEPNLTELAKLRSNTELAKLVKTSPERIKQLQTSGRLKAINGKSNLYFFLNCTPDETVSEFKEAIDY